MNLDLAGKIAFITGASSGIGAAVAKIFAEEGADVVISYHRDAGGAGQAAETVRALGRRAWLCQVDITDPADIQRALSQLQDEVPAFDVLVLCAGQNIVTPFGKIDPQEWDQVIRVNLNGAFYMLQSAAPKIRDGGCVVTVASVAAQTGAPHHPHYAAAKAGLVNLTKSAARALAPRVRVNCVSPGLTLTPMGKETIASLAPDYAEKKLLVQRFATPEEIARCIVFIASPAAGFISGATIDINGGRELR